MSAPTPTSPPSRFARPLAGLRVLVTRAEDQADSLCNLLAAAGATPVHFPTIATVAMPDTASLDRAIARLATYDGLLFTSTNGVAFFWDRLQAAGHATIPTGLLVAAVGAATAQALQERGCSADFVPEVFLGDHIADGLGPVRGKSFLLPRAAIARKALPERLRAAGARVDDIATYQTIAPTPTPEARAALRQGVEVLTFTSSSTVRNFIALAGDEALSLGQQAVVACIGPVTAATARDLGFAVALVPQAYTAEALVEALCAHMTATRPF